MFQRNGAIAGGPPSIELSPELAVPSSGNSTFKETNASDSIISMNAQEQYEILSCYNASQGHRLYDLLIDNTWLQSSSLRRD